MILLVKPKFRTLKKKQNKTYPLLKPEKREVVKSNQKVTLE